MAEQAEQEINKPASSSLFVQVQTKPKTRKTNEEKEREALAQTIKRTQDASRTSIDVCFIFFRTY